MLGGVISTCRSWDTANLVATSIFGISFGSKQGFDMGQLAQNHELRDKYAVRYKYKTSTSQLAG